MLKDIIINKRGRSKAYNKILEKFEVEMDSADVYTMYFHLTFDVTCLKVLLIKKLLSGMPITNAPSVIAFGLKIV